MIYYKTLLKKEIIESIRTYKLFIMLMLFGCFGIMSPFIAKLTPYIFESFMPEGILITIEEPTGLDAWAQYFKNISQLGLIIVVIVFSSSLVSELSKGTLINILTKGMPRKVVIISKYISMILIWTLSMLLSFIITWFYTLYLFSLDGIHNLFFSVFCLWLFGLFLLSLLMFFSTFIKTNYGVLLSVGFVTIGGIILNIIPIVQKYNVVSLATKNMELITSFLTSSYFYPLVGLTIISVIILLLLAIIIFEKKEL